MFDVEVHPQYAQNGWIYLVVLGAAARIHAAAAAAEPAPRRRPPGRGGRGPQTPITPSMTVIVRGKINKNNEWTDQQVIFRAPPELYTTNNSHYGSRFIFDTQGHLFYSHRRARRASTNAQDLSNPLGKIHRVNDDGSVPKDNPFVNKPGAVPTIWSYGHRNPQGLAWDPVTGKLWESEHGPQGGDEINIIEPGRNYGWGVITMGIQPGITKRARAGDGAADRLLHADDRAERHVVLHRHAVSRLEEQPVRQRARRPAAPPPGSQRRQGHAPGGGVQPVRPRARRRSRGPTAIST